MPDRPHPDRAAPNLALRSLMLDGEPREPAPSPPGAVGDARVDLQLLVHRARSALAERGNAAARARFAAVDSPGLLSGIVQDGTARGVMVALEEAISLCDGESPSPAECDEPEPDAACFEGRELRRKKDVLVASGGARIRWSRKGGVLFVDRAHDVHEDDCLRFEDRSDHGDLDAFVGDPDERPRLFSPAYLQPVRLTQGKARDHLWLEGRLGRRPGGTRCRIDFIGRKHEPFVRIVLRFVNEHDDHRLRLRILGCRDHRAIAADGTPGIVALHAGGHHFVAATLVRACGRLRVGDAIVAVPGAQGHGPLRHEFRLGGFPWRGDGGGPA